MYTRLTWRFSLRVARRLHPAFAFGKTLSGSAAAESESNAAESESPHGHAVSLDVVCSPVYPTVRSGIVGISECS